MEASDVIYSGRVMGANVILELLRQLLPLAVVWGT